MFSFSLDLDHCNFNFQTSDLCRSRAFTNINVELWHEPTTIPRFQTLSKPDLNIEVIEVVEEDSQIYLPR